MALLLSIWIKLLYIWICLRIYRISFGLDAKKSIKIHVLLAWAWISVAVVTPLYICVYVLFFLSLHSALFVVNIRNSDGWWHLFSFFLHSLKELAFIESIERVMNRDQVEKRRKKGERERIDWILNKLKRER